MIYDYIYYIVRLSPTTHHTPHTTHHTPRTMSWPSTPERSSVSNMEAVTPQLHMLVSMVPFNERGNHNPLVTPQGSPQGSPSCPGAPKRKQRNASNARNARSCCRRLTDDDENPSLAPPQIQRQAFPARGVKRRLVLKRRSERVSKKTKFLTTDKNGQQTEKTL